MKASQVFKVQWGLLLLLTVGLPVAVAGSAGDSWDVTVSASQTKIDPKPIEVASETKYSVSHPLPKLPAIGNGYSAGIFDASTFGPLPSTLIIILLGIITLVLTRQRR